MPLCTLCKDPAPLTARYDGVLKLCWICHVWLWFKQRDGERLLRELRGQGGM